MPLKPGTTSPPPPPHGLPRTEAQRRDRAIAELCEKLTELAELVREALEAELRDGRS